MTGVWTVLFFAYGTVFGSFYNVVGLRVPKKESIISPPSHCTVCDRRLTFPDLVPVLSFIVLRGKCRGCGTKISPLYPFMEFITGVLFAWAFIHFGFSPELAVALVFLSMLVIISVSDIAYMLIPDKILLPAGVLLVLLRILSPLTPWWDSVLGAAAGFGILLLVAIVSKGGMGGGDIKLFFVIGVVLGTQLTLLTLFLAALIGSVTGILHLRRTGQGRKTPVPFGPSIAAAAVICYFVGDALVGWYLTLFT